MRIWLGIGRRGQDGSGNKNQQDCVRLFLDNSEALTKPIFVIKKIKTGSWKETPKPRRNFRVRDKYSLKDNIGLRKSVLKDTKNLKAGGNTRKYPKHKPPENRMVEARTKGMAYFFSPG